MITDGQRVRALESNAAWASKQADNTMLGIQTLARAGSGATIPDAQQKINDLISDVALAQSDIANLQSLDTFIYVGTWNATTNSPLLANGDGGSTFGPGATYRVSVAGSVDFGAGLIAFAVGDKVVYNNSGVWEKWDTDDTNISLDDLSDVVVAGAPQRSLIQKGPSTWDTLNPNEVVTNSTLTGSNQTVPATDGFFKVIRLTNAGLVSVEGIGLTYDQQKIILVNETTVSFTVKNDAAGTPTQGIITGTGADLTLQNKQTLFLVYDSTSARWRIIGGSGAGGGVGFQETPAGVVNGSNVTFGPLTYVPSNDDSIMVFVDGILLKDTEWAPSGLNITLSVAPALGQSVYVFYMTQGTIAPPPVISGVWKTEYRTLTGGEITAKQITLAHTPTVSGEVMLDVIGGGPQFYGDDFIVTAAILDWNGLGLDGVLLAGDKLRVAYVY